MKGRTVVLDAYLGREAAALMVDGRLEDFFVASESVPPGTIYRARVDRPMKGQGGMFLSTPDGPAFLRRLKGLAPGQTVLVQVTGCPDPGKALPVTARILFKSRYAIVTPDAPGINVSRAIRDEDVRERLQEIAADSMGDREFGLILRSACASDSADSDAIAADIDVVARLADRVTGDSGTAPERLLDGDGPHAIAWREWTRPAEVDDTPGGFETHGVLEALEIACGETVPLPGGATLHVEPTRALVAVDVNTGQDSSPAAGTKANIEAARDLPRLLRIRGLGGQVTIDPAPMPRKDRRSFEQALRAALGNDGEETVMAGWTPLGHFELRRSRGRVPLPVPATAP